MTDVEDDTTAYDVCDLFDSWDYWNETSDWNAMWCYIQGGTYLKGSPHEGPKAALEYFEEVPNAGQTVLQYHLEWRNKSGISEK